MEPLSGIEPALLRYKGSVRITGKGIEMECATRFERALSPWKGEVLGR